MHKNICDSPLVSYANKKKNKQTFLELHKRDNDVAKYENKCLNTNINLVRIINNTVKLFDISHETS